MEFLALFAKFAPSLDLTWRHIGGSAIAFQAFKTYIFGKMFRTMEYPDGNMITVTIRWNTIGDLKKAILKEQEPIYPGVEYQEEDILALSCWTPPHFTEPLNESLDIRVLPEGSWVLWSRVNSEIPKRGVTLLKELTETEQIDSLIQFLEFLSRQTDPELRISPSQLELLVQLIITPEIHSTKDLQYRQYSNKSSGINTHECFHHREALLTLHRNFKEKPKLFTRYVLSYLTRNRLLQESQTTTTSPLSNNQTPPPNQTLKERAQE